MWGNSCHILHVCLMYCFCVGCVYVYVNGQFIVGKEYMSFLGFVSYFFVLVYLSVMHFTLMCYMS